MTSESQFANIQVCQLDLLANSFHPQSSSTSEKYLYDSNYNLLCPGDPYEKSFIAIDLALNCRTLHCAQGIVMVKNLLIIVIKF